LQELLNLPVPSYHHHKLLTDEKGNRLAKRDKAITLKSLRESGVSAESLKSQVSGVQ
jgi:glutamyl-Q tRNA(Asp) synthetase